MKRMSRLLACAVITAALGASSCSLDKQEMPALSGPSGLGKAVVMTASPDQLPRDSQSQSIVTLEVRDNNGNGMSGQVVTLGVTPGVVLSTSQVTTGRDGRATFAVVAPSPTALVPNNTIVVTAVPVGANFDNATSGSLSIALLGPSNSTAPTPVFTVTPAAPELNTLATFDASPTMDEGGRCLDACTYAWNFDDGGIAAGRVVTHAFTIARSYNVALTVTDAVGIVVTGRQFVTPTVPAAPTAKLAVAPIVPVVNQQATFTVTTTVAASHSIVRYDWNFGDGSSASTGSSTTTHTYSARGIYTATVRVMDDLGQFGSDSLRLDLTIGVPTGINADFFFSPTDPGSGQTVFYDANASTPSNGASITNYRWDFGDGVGEDDGTTATTSHPCASKNTFAVKLTVTDSQNRVGTVTHPVTCK